MRNSRETLSAALGISLAIASCNIPSDTHEVTPVPTSIPSHRAEQDKTISQPLRLIGNNERKVQQKASLTASFDKEEMDLWESGYHRHVYAYPAVPMQEQAIDWVFQTLWRMQNSKIPQFSIASADIKKALQQDGHLIWPERTFASRFTKSDKIVEALLVVPKDKQPFMLIAVYLDAIVNRSDAMSLAFALTAEAVKIRNIQAYHAGNAYRSDDDILKSERQRKASIEYLIEEQAQVQATLAEAYIFAYGLGYRNGAGGPLEDLAVAYIDRGQNAKDPRWTEYIENSIRQDSRS